MTGPQPGPDSGRRGGSLGRMRAMIGKEFTQMRRDRVGFAIMIFVSAMQILLFGFAINLNPRNLPTAVVLADDGPLGRAIVAGLETSGYFRVTERVVGGADLEALMQAGRVQFGLEIPSDLTRRVTRGQTGEILLLADDTDPGAVVAAIAAIDRIVASALTPELRGALADRRPPPPAVAVVVHRRYNPEIDTAKVIVPGLLGVILLSALPINTALAVTRERERGTMEKLLSMPLTPLEIMIGKIVPFISVGVIQTTIVLVFALGLFDVPLRGSLLLLWAVVMLFIVAVLAVGYLMSTVSRTELQAAQMTTFFFLPNLLLSGFAFPFRGMPDWAQAIGELLPLTHFERIVRGIMLKGADAGALAYDIGALAVFTALVLGLGLVRFRRTLD